MLPEKFENRMKEILKGDYEAFKSSYSEKPVRAFRVNTRKISVEDFLKLCPFPVSQIPYSDNGFYFDCDSVGNTPYHHAGMIYVQEPAAMAVAECLDIKSDWTVLDLCAAPGGKTTQLACKVKDGVIVSNEIIPSRCKILTGNVERMGLNNVITACADSAKLSSLFGNEFDLVVVDAPCSGEGMFRKDETAVSEWSEENVTRCAERQKEILSNIRSVVKYGGYMIYSTCTFSVEENEKVVDSFLSENSDFELFPVTERVKAATADGICFDGCKCKNINECRRFYPHISSGEGQFMALLHRKSVGDNYSKPREEALVEIPKSEFKTVKEFLDGTLENYESGGMKKYKNNIVYFPFDFTVPRGIAFSCGVTVGEVRKHYIQPHHQLFTALGKNFKRQIELSEAQTEKYLRGETVECDCENGWAAVLYNGCTLGGVKAVNSAAKNHYPKGLRNLK
ncbi:MAG: NOL1/NOP2/sun family putative RNA methylase [Clostridia bacterium]|nr:NOL1/NOP2/sun family putative RNA methylase [Clostridia bacterium]